MLPPVLEIYVLWHPDDGAGSTVARQLDQHFHGDLFTGLIGGAVEVYRRSAGWLRRGDTPRPIPFPDDPPPNGVTPAALTAIVPILGFRLAKAVEETSDGWWAYANRILKAQNGFPRRVAIFPLQVDRGVDKGQLGSLFGAFQHIGRGAMSGEDEEQIWCRDLVQGIAQFAGDDDQSRLTVFISHTRSASTGQEDRNREVTSRVRHIIGNTRLREFFATHDLQPGTDYTQELRSQAARSAMLAIRTDHYASRPWCQTEILTAKCAGMPIVMIDALTRGDQRGSFLMDHTPRVPVTGSGHDLDAGIRTSLNLLVDQCLKRVLWQQQRKLAEALAVDLGVSWWAPHAPEPATLSAWATDQRERGDLPARVRILHPDPPLGEAERRVLEQMAAWGGIASDRLDILTPRQVAARGG